jgi:hypothetical protein
LFDSGFVLSRECATTCKIVVADNVSGNGPLRGRLHVSDSAYESPYDSVHNLHTKGIGFLISISEEHISEMDALAAKNVVKKINVIFGIRQFVMQLTVFIETCSNLSPGTLGSWPPGTRSMPSSPAQ